jgi:quinohemoprotein ethanol dehydrogenase
MVLRRGLKRLAIWAAIGLATASCGPAALPRGDRDRNWPVYGGDTSQAHYTPLDQINARNVRRLKLAWFHDIDVLPNAYSEPLEVDGVLYFAAGYSIVEALDTRTGRLLWRYDPHAAETAGVRMRAAWGVRGLAYDAGRIFVGAVDGRLIALDARTGRQLWSVMTVDPGDGRYITGPPLVFRGRVLIGHGGADFAPVRGYVTAYAAATGARLWRFYTVPGNPSLGFENDAMRVAAKTWTGSWWRFGGGGTVWNAMTYDPRYDAVYIGTGNGAPWNRHVRSPGGGDNLFLSSIVALDAATGQYRWHYQVNPGESWDYNAAMDIELADMPIGGRVRHVILHAPKDGFFYVIDRATGKLLSAAPFVRRITWTRGIDPQSGRPLEVSAARDAAAEPFVVFPSPAGAHSVEAMSFDPRSGLVYLPVIERGAPFINRSQTGRWAYRPGEVVNTGWGAPSAPVQLPAPTNRLLAWDPVRQREVWSQPLPGVRNGGVLSTAGGLVFQGNVTGHLVAYEASAGRPLWSFDAQNGVLAQPISFSLAGRQYVTVIASWRMTESSGSGLDWDYRAQKRRVLTFALDGDATLPQRAPAQPPPLIEGKELAADLVASRRGAALFAEHCIICHGVAAKAGGAAPDLRRAPIVLDAAGFASVLHGGALRDDGMPQFAELPPPDLKALRAYIATQAGIASAGR